MGDAADTDQTLLGEIAALVRRAPSRQQFLYELRKLVDKYSPQGGYEGWPSWDASWGQDTAPNDESWDEPGPAGPLPPQKNTTHRQVLMGSPGQGAATHEEGWQVKGSKRPKPKVTSSVPPPDGSGKSRGQGGAKGKGKGSNLPTFRIDMSEWRIKPSDFGTNEVYIKPTQVAEVLDQNPKSSVLCQTDDPKVLEEFFGLLQGVNNEVSTIFFRGEACAELDEIAKVAIVERKQLPGVVSGVPRLQWVWQVSSSAEPAHKPQLGDNSSFVQVQAPKVKDRNQGTLVLRATLAKSYVQDAVWQRACSRPGQCFREWVSTHSPAALRCLRDTWGWKVLDGNRMQGLVRISDSHARTLLQHSGQTGGDLVFFTDALSWDAIGVAVPAVLWIEWGSEETYAEYLRRVQAQAGEFGVVRQTRSRHQG